MDIDEMLEDKVSEKELNLHYIKAFSSIGVKEICESLGVNRSNLYNGKTSVESTRRVRKEIEKRIAEIQKILGGK